MDIGALKKDELKAWVDFDEEVSVELRFLPREELASLGKRAVVTRFDLKTRKEEKEYDALAAEVMIGKAAIVNWRGLVSDGEEFPCTPENIEMLMLKWGDFSRFINTACVDLRAMVQAQRAVTEKN